MDNINPVKRIFYRYQGIMYWLIHWTDTHKIIGISASSFVRLFSLVMPVLAWIQGWGGPALGAALVFFVWVQFSYWRGRRTGYYRFVGEDMDLLSTDNIQPIGKNQHLKVCASGVFSLKDWESNVVLRPAEYWQVPLGDHAFMVEHVHGRYLYQFISAKLMQNLQKGWLLFGTKPRPALSISFLSTWGPEFNDDDFSFRRKDKNKPFEKQRIIYLSFDDKETEEAVWQNLLYDARRVRTEATS